MQRNNAELHAGSCVEIATPIATPAPIFTTLFLSGIIPEILFHSFHNLVNIPVPVTVSVPVPRVASKNSCLWRIIFVIFPLNDGDIETLEQEEEEEEEEEEEDMFLFRCYYYFLLDK